MTEYLGELSL